MAVNAMETDDLSHISSSTLRRSNSAPNVSAAAMSDNAPAFQSLHISRQRRFSTSQMALNVGSPASRVEQIKREESIDDMSRERQQENVNTMKFSEKAPNEEVMSDYCKQLGVVNENELISEIALNNSWDESMNLMVSDKNNEAHGCMHWRRNSFEDDSHLSMSPTRFPTRPVPIRSRSLTPSPGPSPTRQTFRHRSVSPVCLRPPSLTYKRKYRPEGFEPGVSPSKRMCDPASSPESSSESDRLQFEEDTNLQDDQSVSASVAQPPVSLLFGDTSRPLAVSSIFKSRLTPPRSPLAGPSTSQHHTDPPRTIGSSPSCFNFAPVRD